MKQPAAVVCSLDN